MERTDMLKPLDDLAYLLECAALDHTGELKSALAALCSNIQSRALQYGAPEVQAALPQLEKALEKYRSSQNDAGALGLTAVSRSWWAVILP